MGFFSAAVVRFDMPCHGASAMTGEDFSLRNCVGALLAVARMARETFPGTQNLCIFATGFGAYVTLVALEELMELEAQGLLTADLVRRFRRSLCEDEAWEPFVGVKLYVLDLFLETLGE